MLVMVSLKTPSSRGCVVTARNTQFQRVCGDSKGMQPEKFLHQKEQYFTLIDCCLMVTKQEISKLEASLVVCLDCCWETAVLPMLHGCLTSLVVWCRGPRRLTMMMRMMMVITKRVHVASRMGQVLGWGYYWFGTRVKETSWWLHKCFIRILTHKQWGDRCIHTFMWSINWTSNTEQ